MTNTQRRLIQLFIPLAPIALAATPVLAAEGEHGPSAFVFVTQLALLMLVGRLLGEIMIRFKQPGVMGQLIAGLVLGPSLLGAVFPDLQHAIFPSAKEQKAMLDGVSQFGVLLLLLLTGMETDLKLVRRTAHAAAAASIAGIVVPFICGVALGEALPDSMLPDPSKRMITSLFLGTSLSIASVKIVASVIRDMNFMRRTVGQVILASSIIDDTVGWMIIAVIFSLTLQGHVHMWSVAQSVLGTLAFMGLSLTVGRRIVFIIIRWVNDVFKSDFAVITAILLIMCAMALITDFIGVHGVLGAFVAGILIGESPILTRHIDEQLRGLIIAFFMPVFFGTAGLSADLTILKDMHLLLLTVGMIAIASIGKFSGAFIGGKFAGLTFRESLALGTGMNARGSTEVIVATIGLSMGALSQNLFTMIVTMAVITSMAMPPTLRWALARLPMRKDEKQRLEREEMEARSFVSKLERLLLVVDESDNARLATRIAGLIAGGSAMPTTVMQIKTKGPKPEAVAEEAEKGYSLMIVGLEKTVARRNEFHEDITKLATGFEEPLAVVDARDKLLEQPLDAKFNILVPVNGTEYSRRAAEVAIAIARASRAPVAALYVAPRGRKRSRRYEEAILKDISRFAETYDTDIRTAVRAHIAAEEAILKELVRRQYNLVVIGAGRRPGEKLFFGDTASALLEKSGRSLLFIAS